MGAATSQSCIMTTNDVANDLMEIDRKLRNVFCNWEGTFLTNYHPYPALVQGEVGNRISICFTATDYDYIYRNRVQSELAQYVNVQVGLRMQNITLVHRILPSSDTAQPIWQVLFTETSTTPASRLIATGLVLKTTVQEQAKTSTQQSTGSDQTGFVEEHVSEKDAEVTMPVTQGVARGVLTKAPIWHLNLVETVQQLRETSDSPLSVAMGTAVHTVIDKLSYGDVSKFPTAHRWWAYSHESAAPTIYVEYKFISAATIVNQLIVGIADCNKSTYTMEELQQIEGVVLNPQDGTIEVPLKLAATSLDNYAPTRVTMSQTAINGTDADPVNVPTLVILTATGIQNAYDNDKVQVNIRKKVRFGNVNKEPWFITSRSLTTMRSLLNPGSSFSASTASFKPVSELLGLPKGYPMFITLDGAYIGGFSAMPMAVAVSKNLSRTDTSRSERAMTTSFACGNEANTGNPSYNAFFSGSGGTSFIINTMTATQVANFLNKGELTTNAILADQLKSIYTNTNSPLYDRNPVIVFTTMGEIELPSSKETISMVRSDDQSMEDFTYSVLVQWAESLTNWSTTISEFPSTEVVSASFVPQTVTHQRHSNYYLDDNDQFTMIGVHSVGTRVNIKDTRKVDVNYKWVVEMQRNSEAAVVIYVGYAQSNDEETTYFTTLHDNITASSSTEFMGEVNFLYNTFNTETSGNTRHVSFTNSSRAGVTFDDISLAQKPARVVYHNSNAVASLDGTMSRLIFSATLPKTIPTTIAGGQAGVEVHDDYVYTQLRLLITKLGINVTDDQVLTFQLYMTSGLRAAATVVWDGANNECYVVNNPSDSADRYMTLRKLTAEEVYIGNFAVVEKASSVISSTNTSNWINRVVSDTSTSVYTGALLSQLKVRTVRRTNTSQGEAMLPLLMGMQQGGNFMQSIMQYFMMKGQLNLQQQQKLEQMEKKFQYDMQLQKSNQEFQMKLKGLGNDLAQSAAVGNAPQYPGLGYTDPVSSNGTSEIAAANNADNFDSTIARFREMLYNTAGLTTPDEEIARPASGIPLTPSGAVAALSTKPEPVTTPQASQQVNIPLETFGNAPSNMKYIPFIKPSSETVP